MCISRMEANWEEEMDSQEGLGEGDEGWILSEYIIHWRKITLWKSMYNKYIWIRSFIISFVWEGRSHCAAWTDMECTEITQLLSANTFFYACLDLAFALAQDFAVSHCPPYASGERPCFCLGPFPLVSSAICSLVMYGWTWRFQGISLTVCAAL